jgi:pyruvate,water dikinase
MKKILLLHELDHRDRSRVGGKGFVLSKMAEIALLVPPTACITADAYNEYLDLTGLRERIMLEIHRKDLSDMRWEEIWDASARIRNMLLNTPLPETLDNELKKNIEAYFIGKQVVVRSSAIDEDSAQASFAGLHESVVNVTGTEAIMEAVRRVWASLWSDAAILYRNETGLDAETSAMAVIIQEMIFGECSGVAFSRNPNEESQTVIESVYGLNQGLVDGQVEPDRWLVDRKSKKIISHTPVHRDRRMVPDKGSVVFEPLPEILKDRPPLSQEKVLTVFQTAQDLEDRFKSPQDIEWTFKNDQLYLLQSRPVTTTYSDDPMDKRSWYLSLHRSFENLKALRKKIDEEFIPEMIQATSQMAALNLSTLTHTALMEEIARRQKINEKWSNVYWSDFIPFAHGIRLFGQVYNDTVRPDNPYEFVDLLGQTKMVSLERNRMLADLAAMVRSDIQLRKKLENRDYPSEASSFMKTVANFITSFGDLSCPVTGATQCSQGPEALIRIVLEMAAHAPVQPASPLTSKIESLRNTFLERFEGEDRTWAEELLDLARTSYQLRDDDNIHLGRIEAQVMAAVQEAQQRVLAADATGKDSPDIQALREMLTTAHTSESKPLEEKSPRPNDFNLKARQLIGQPAGPGLSKGKARVIVKDADLSEFKHGEILVCDAVDPNMTFVVPLAAGIVERRGGMLIHGAIIAREYGLACVTGVPEVTRLIETGDSLTVDGYLGIVTIG